MKMRCGGISPLYITALNGDWVISFMLRPLDTQKTDPSHLINIARCTSIDIFVSIYLDRFYLDRLIYHYLLISICLDLYISIYRVQFTLTCQYIGINQLINIDRFFRYVSTDLYRYKSLSGYVNMHQ
jgi:hypothetical protein